MCMSHAQGSVLEPRSFRDEAGTKRDEDFVPAQSPAAVGSSVSRDEGTKKKKDSGEGEQTERPERPFAGRSSLHAEHSAAARVGNSFVPSFRSPGVQQGMGFPAGTKQPSLRPGFVPNQNGSDSSPLAWSSGLTKHGGEPSPAQK